MITIDVVIGPRITDDGLLIVVSECAALGSLTLVAGMDDNQQIDRKEIKFDMRMAMVSRDVDCEVKVVSDSSYCFGQVEMSL